jgi:multimeric flavodoxin WrbA
MKRICLLNGSLRGERASSFEFLKRVSTGMNAADFHIEQLTVKSSAVDGCYPHETLAAMANADAVIMAFPLFCYTLPGALTRFLEDFYSCIKEGELCTTHGKVFAIINCGFPEPGIIEEAIRVVRNFCARLGLSYRFAIAIAAGPVTVMTMKVPFLNPRLKKAITDIVKDVESDETARREDVFITPIIPRAILIKIKEHYENKSPSLRPREPPASPAPEW